MKKLISFILLAATASSGILLAQVENRIEKTERSLPGNITTNYNNQGTGCRLKDRLEATDQVTGCRLQVVGTNQTTEGQIWQQADATTNYELPTANCDNQGCNLDFHLMMNPSTLEDGTKAIGEALGIFKRGEDQGRISSVRVGAENNDVVRGVSSSFSANQVLRLRGGGPKKSQTTGGLKTTGDSSDEEDAPDLESEDTQQMNSEVSKYLKKEIINNIYEECLAEVANLSLGGRMTSESVSKEAAEWNAAEKAAEFAKGKAERFLEKIRIETEEARRIADESKRNVRELERAPKPENTADQAVASATITYEKAIAAYAASNYKAKKLAVELAEARVETASAVLQAIMVRKSSQHAPAAEAELDAAKEAEEEALEAAEVAKTEVEAKAALMNSAEANLNSAKQAVYASSRTDGNNSSTNMTSSMTAAQRVAMREIEQDKVAAEEVRAKAKKAEIIANNIKAKVTGMNCEKEFQAYHNAEEAWGETVEGYKIVLARTKEAGLDDEELLLAMANAEIKQSSWRADTCWAKAKQAIQMVAAARDYVHSLAVAKTAQTAWDEAVEEYKKALLKATEAHASKKHIEELTTSLNNVVNARSQALVEIQSQVQMKINEVQCIAAGKNGEIESAFARARAAKNESAWNEAGRIAREVSNYWEGVSKDIRAGSCPLSLTEEEAIQQREQCKQKANLTEVKILALRPCDGSETRKTEPKLHISMLIRGDKDKRCSEMMQLIKNKVWPTVSQAMKAFNDHPSIAKMAAVREVASMSASAYASAYAFSPACYHSASALASISACVYVSPAVHVFYNDISSAAPASVYASSISAASLASVVNTLEVIDVEEITERMLRTSVSAATSARNSRFNSAIQENYDWSVTVAREVAEFARAVVRFKREQEIPDIRPVLQWKAQAQTLFTQALAQQNENSWKNAVMAAKEAVLYCNDVAEKIKAGRNVQEMTLEEAIYEKEHWTEKANIAEVRAFEQSPYEKIPGVGETQLKNGRAYQLAKMIREKIGSPVSKAMKEFIAHPSVATMLGIRNPYISAMGVTEAAEAVENAEIFVNESAFLPDQARGNNVMPITRESADWSVAVIREVAEFARTVANFKATKQP